MSVAVHPKDAPLQVRRPAPQKASDNESWPGASPRCWPGPALDEARFGGLRDSCREPVDDPRKYPLHAVQSRSSDSHAWTSRRPTAGRRPLRRLRGYQRTGPELCPRTQQTVHDPPQREAGCATAPRVLRGYPAPLLLSATPTFSDGAGIFRATKLSAKSFRPTFPNRKRNSNACGGHQDDSDDNNQNTAFFNGALFASYMADHYDASFIYSRNYLKMNENGGITDDQYITNPKLKANGGRIYETQNIPTYLDASTDRNSEYYLYFTHRCKFRIHPKRKSYRSR